MHARHLAKFGVDVRAAILATLAAEPALAWSVEGMARRLKRRGVYVDPASARRILEALAKAGSATKTREPGEPARYRLAGK